ncbi:uncharacterized protein LOC142322221 [Lycorma delicatula]|uniref:uncharacterized protein LOC142322221 n=1 Tax=Lycorma delicatula TaxID=130591 RepID=UPI003F517500
MNLITLFMAVLVVLMNLTLARSSLQIINLLRESFAGKPEFHRKQSWPFDPEVAARRRVDFERINGYRSMGLIERLGLGEDGRQDERRIQQAIRDEGIPITGRR